MSGGNYSFGTSEDIIKAGGRSIQYLQQVAVLFHTNNRWQECAIPAASEEVSYIYSRW